jgi:glutathione S-transferase
MKLYIAPGSCSLGPHIAMREAGLSFDVEKVDLRAKKTADGGDYRAVNPKGAVPALRLDDGQVLTEGSAIYQYIADQKPEKHLAPPAGKMERYRLQEWLNYIASEIHKGLSVLFRPGLSPENQQMFKDRVGMQFDFLSKNLEARNYLMGDTYTVADSYLYAIVSQWPPKFGMDVAKWPVLKAYLDRIAARPAVQATLKAEAA